MNKVYPLDSGFSVLDSVITSKRIFGYEGQLRQGDREKSCTRQNRNETMALLRVLADERLRLSTGNERSRSELKTATEMWTQRQTYQHWPSFINLFKIYFSFIVNYPIMFEN